MWQQNFIFLFLVALCTPCRNMNSRNWTVSCQCFWTSLTYSTHFSDRILWGLEGHKNIGYCTFSKWLLIFYHSSNYRQSHCGILCLDEVLGACRSWHCLRIVIFEHMTVHTNFLEEKKGNKKEKEMMFISISSFVYT